MRNEYVVAIIHTVINTTREVKQRETAKYKAEYKIISDKSSLDELVFHKVY